MTSAASFSALEALCSPSAAITCKFQQTSRILTAMSIPKQLYINYLHATARSKSNPLTRHTDGPKCFEDLIRRLCDAMAEWSEALASVFCAWARADSSSPAQAHIDRPHSLWTAALGTGRNTLTCSVWVDSVCYMNSCSNSVTASLGGGGGKAAAERR